ncbi:MAG: GNAT family N-acetyltransferase [Pseudomonadota bacterium]
MPIQLITPALQYQTSYQAYIEELGDETRYPFPMDFAHADFPALLARLDEFRQGINIPDGFVPSSTYWLVEGNELLGVSNLRHHLNNRIRHVGGHIGLGVRPSRRGTGLGKTLLKLTLAKAAEKAITPIHVHCYKHNEPSARMILANGGQLDSEIAEAGEVVQRYLIGRHDNTPQASRSNNNLHRE